MEGAIWTRENVVRKGFPYEDQGVMESRLLWHICVDRSQIGNWCQSWAIPA